MAEQEHLHAKLQDAKAKEPQNRREYGERASQLISYFKTAVDNTPEFAEALKKQYFEESEEFESGDSPELAQGLPYKGKSMRNRGVSSPMPFLLIPRSLLRGGFITIRSLPIPSSGTATSRSAWRIQLVTVGRLFKTSPQTPWLQQPH